MTRAPFLSLLSRGSPLVVLSVMDITTPFLRMLVLTHFLDLRELGFAAALATTFGMFEQVTDILMNRFVFSAPHEDYEEALAAAQALSVIRGAVVGLLVGCCLAAHRLDFRARRSLDDFRGFGRDCVHQIAWRIWARVPPSATTNTPRSSKATSLARLWGLARC